MPSDDLTADNQREWENDALRYRSGDKVDGRIGVTFQNVEDVECHWDEESGVVMFKTSPAEAEELHEQMNDNDYGFHEIAHIVLEFTR